jgi:hypothetical protein
MYQLNIEKEFRMRLRKHIYILLLSMLINFTAYAANILTKEIVELPIEKLQSYILEPCLSTTCIDTFNQYKKYARHRHSSAMSALAEFYYTGYGTDKDIGKALKYFRRSAKYRFAPAQFKAARIYFNEPDFIDIEQGLKYLKKAARNGHGQAAYTLGVIYSTDYLEDTDYNESDKWLLIAYKAGHNKTKRYIEQLQNSNDFSSDNFPSIFSLVNHYANKYGNKTEVIRSNQLAKLPPQTNSITWPEDDDMEIITVSAPSLEEMLHFDIIRMVNLDPNAGIGQGTGTSIIGRQCGNCKKMSLEDFSRLVAQSY